MRIRFDPKEMKKKNREKRKGKEKQRRKWERRKRREKGGVEESGGTQHSQPGNTARPFYDKGKVKRIAETG